MRPLPLDDPGTPRTDSPGAFLWWVARGQWRTLALGAGFGIVWMSAQAVMPAIIGRAIDAGVDGDDQSSLAWWAAALFAVGVLQAGAGVLRHRCAVANWLTAAYRIVQLVSRQSVRLGSSLSRQVSSGEVVAIGTTDMAHVGQVMDVSARFSGAIVSFLLVAAILLSISWPLGLVVLLGVPLIMLAIGPLLSPLQARSARQRQLTGELSNTATDIVGGLRVLRGIGGEQVFHDRYARESQQVRRAGVQVARVQSVLDALEVLLPGLFVVIVVWLGARSAVDGDLSPGELVSFYGYSAFLMLPLRTVTEYANKVIRGRVAAARICRVMALDPDVVVPAVPVSPKDGDLIDHESGVRVPHGALVTIVSDQPDDAARLADRLGGFAPGRVTYGEVELTRMDPAELRRRILVSDSGAALFSGRLAERIGTRAETALITASADDILDALPEGLDTMVAERGRSFSGGQRQRLVLARALARDPDVLVLVEPTSAVDAHTEARIAVRLREHRRGRTTVVTTTSPLLLDTADLVVLLDDGRVVATGTHQHLLGDPAYRAVVTREVTA